MDFTITTIYLQIGEVGIGMDDTQYASQYLVLLTDYNFTLSIKDMV